MKFDVGFSKQVDERIKCHWCEGMIYLMTMMIKSDNKNTFIKSESKVFEAGKNQKC